MRYKYIYLLLLQVLLISSVNADDAKLSEGSTISLITCGSGSELYSTFGHSAIRVQDTVNNIDQVYNYGTFHFNDEFYVKFVRGKLNYYLSVSDFERFKNSYIRENRSVYEQVLNLSLQDRRKVYAYLTNNYKPENRYYLYDFFYDNCSTRELDLLRDVLDDRLRLPENIDAVSDSSFRQLTDPFLVDMPWADFGIDLGLGSPTDKKATYAEHSFLPVKLKQILSSAEITNNDNTQPLVVRENVLYEATATTANDNFQLTPSVLFWVLFLLVVAVSYHNFQKGKYLLKMDSAIFGVSGFFGLFLLFLWFGTDHTATAYNYNLLWALPTHIIFTLTILKKPQSRYYKPYLIFTIFSCLCMFVIWVADVQNLHRAILPIALTLIVRSAFLLKGALGVGKTNVVKQEDSKDLVSEK